MLLKVCSPSISRNGSSVNMFLSLHHFVDISVAGVDQINHVLSSQFQISSLLSGKVPSTLMRPASPKDPRGSPHGPKSSRTGSQKMIQRQKECLKRQLGMRMIAHQLLIMSRQCVWFEWTVIKYRRSTSASDNE